MSDLPKECDESSDFDNGDNESTSKITPDLQKGKKIVCSGNIETRTILT